MNYVWRVAEPREHKTVIEIKYSNRKLSREDILKCFNYSSMGYETVQVFQRIKSTIESTRGYWCSAENK